MTWLIIVLEITHMVHSEGKSARLVAKGGRRYPTLLPTLTDTLCSASGMNPILNSPAYIVIARVILLAKKYSVPLDNYRTPWSRDNKRNTRDTPLRRNTREGISKVMGLTSRNSMGLLTLVL